MLLERILNDKKLLSVFIISLFVCGFFIHGFPIYILDEAKNSEAAREMLINNTFIIPTFNNVLRTDKPPLHYFFMMLSYKMFGVNAFAARFFSSVFGALTILGTFYFTAKLFNKQVAIITWFILLSSVFFVQVFHQAVPDPYLIFFVSMSLFCFLDFYMNSAKLSLLLFYVFLGLGTLSKGPVAIALPGLIILVFLLFKKELFTKKVFSCYPILGGLLTFCIAIPWFLAVHKATNGLFTEGFFLNHNINRFSSKMEGHGGIFLITWAFVILGLLPFSVYIIQGFKHAWLHKNQTFVLFALIVSVVFIVFFSISGTKLPNYTMPCYPFLAFLIAFYIQKIIEKKVPLKWFKRSSFVLIVISVLLPIGAFVAFNIEKQLQPVKWYSLFLLIATIGAFVGYYFIKKTFLKRGIVVIGFSWVVLGMVIFGVIYPKLIVLNPVEKSFSVIPKQSKIVAYKRLDAAFPINYKQTFEVLNTKEAINKFLDANENGIVISNFKHTKKDFESENIEILLEYKALFENHKTIIFKKTEF
ncbi:glycosyltransferase family 39 protein [Seonamhaeicola algicola]|uniref:Glycosyltransferase family 39 protein n=1 Tax=Seonamhaeicola algicola TaxID=1719036 RepID=A0A5C7B1X6_9FLAO|nr:glycosyltransferase family 39 protein [Seonamhaeicola algicola]TXE13963.1 glycosyltransferase family 39 protein [Seonamhaeicola algicola]